MKNCIAAPPPYVTGSLVPPVSRPPGSSTFSTSTPPLVSPDGALVCIVSAGVLLTDWLSSRFALSSPAKKASHSFNLLSLSSSVSSISYLVFPSCALASICFFANHRPLSAAMALSACSASLKWKIRLRWNYKLSISRFKTKEHWIANTRYFKNIFLSFQWNEWHKENGSHSFKYERRSIEQCECFFLFT